MTMKGCLNIDQSPDELSRIYREDYYAYLDSPAFHETFLKPLGAKISEVATCVLDVGCGAAQLADHLSLGARGLYVGIDGSAEAVEQALIKRPYAVVFQERIESPLKNKGWQFDTIVFGGILPVLIKPEKRVEFVQAYLDRFGASQFFVYDLETLDTLELDRHFQRVWKYHAEADLPGLMEVKRRRKIILYRVRS